MNALGRRGGVDIGRDVLAVDLDVDEDRPVLDRPATRAVGAPAEVVAALKMSMIGTRAEPFGDAVVIGHGGEATRGRGQETGMTQPIVYSDYPYGACDCGREAVCEVEVSDRMVSMCQRCYNAEERRAKEQAKAWAVSNTSAEGSDDER